MERRKRRRIKVIITKSHLHKKKYPPNIWKIFKKFIYLNIYNVFS